MKAPERGRHARFGRAKSTAVGKGAIRWNFVRPQRAGRPRSGSKGPFMDTRCLFPFAAKRLLLIQSARVSFHPSWPT